MLEIKLVNDGYFIGIKWGFVRGTPFGILFRFTYRGKLHWHKL
jgi:hypothetical protein